MIYSAVKNRAVALLCLCCCLMLDFAGGLEIPKKNEIKTGCGYRNKRGAGNQVSGALEGEAQFGEFPWMLSIFNNSNKKENFKCGASLIHPQIALTGAHCVDDKNVKYIVRAGGWDLDLLVEILPYQDSEVKETILHPKYVPRALYNDVALLILKNPFKLAEHIGPVCLPPQNHLVESGRGFTMGWGQIKVDNSVEDHSVILKKIEVPIVLKEKCEEKLRTTRFGSSFRLHDSFLCAGGEAGKDTCKGDGGSPLVFPVLEETDRYFQAGIVAWGIKCWSDNPGVYVNVAKFRTWIDEQVTSRGFETSTYQYKPKTV